MNFLFSFGYSLVIVLLLLGLFYSIPTAWYGVLPEPFFKHRRSIAKVILFVIMGFAFYNSLMTYGPRNEIPKTVQGFTPEVKEVQSTSKFIENENRIGQFDEKLKEEK